MSNFEAIALLMAWTVVDTYVILLILRFGLSIFEKVQTGLVDGVPVSIEFRRRLVWSFSSTVHMGVIALNSLGAFLLIQIGMNVDGPKLQNLAYLFATITGLTALVWPIGTASSMRYQLALLRKEEELSDA